MKGLTSLANDLTEKRNDKKPEVSRRSEAAVAHQMRGGAGAGKHKNKQDYERGHGRKPKHAGKSYHRQDEDTTNTEPELTEVQQAVELAINAIEAYKDHPQPDQVETLIVTIRGALDHLALSGANLDKASAWTRQLQALHKKGKDVVFVLDNIADLLKNPRMDESEIEEGENISEVVVDAPPCQHPCKQLIRMIENADPLTEGKLKALVNSLAAYARMADEMHQNLAEQESDEANQALAFVDAVRAALEGASTTLESIQDEVSAQIAEGKIKQFGMSAMREKQAKSKLTTLQKTVESFLAFQDSVMESTRKAWPPLMEARSDRTSLTEAVAKGSDKLWPLIQKELEAEEAAVKAGTDEKPVIIQVDALPKSAKSSQVAEIQIEVLDSGKYHVKNVGSFQKDQPNVTVKGFEKLKALIDAFISKNGLEYAAVYRNEDPMWNAM